MSDNNTLWIVLLDTSGSMNEPFSVTENYTFEGAVEVGEYYSKLQAAKDRLLTEIRSLSSGFVAVIAFSDTPELICKARVSEFYQYESLVVRLQAGGQTDIASAILFALTHVNNFRSTFLIITDGLSNVGDPIGAAKRCDEQPVPIQINTILIDPTPDGERIARAISVGGRVTGVTTSVGLGQAISRERGSFQNRKDYPPPMAAPPAAARPPMAAPPAAARPPMAAPPAAARPPTAAPPAARLYGFLVLLAISGVIVGGAAVLTVSMLQMTTLLFPVSVVALTVALCAIPTIALRLTYARGRLAHFLLETALFLFVLIIFALRDNNIPITAWLPYAIFFVLITEFGGHFIDWYAANTIERVSRYSSHSLNKTADLSRKFFYGGGLLYASVPIGLIGGLIIGLIQNRSNQEVLLLCTQFVLVLASIIIAVLLGISSLRMARSMFTVDDTKSQNQLRVTVTDSISIFGVSGNVLKTIVSQANTSEEYEKRRLSLAQIVSDLRKIHLYDSSHNIILLVALSFAAAGIFGFNIELRWVIIILLLLHLLFAQLPYVIGQLLLQQEILRNSEGMERVELSEKLRKISPLFPTNDFFVTLTATGTAGGFLYIVIDEFIKAALT